MTTFEIGDTDFLLDGEPHRILSGTIHYFRVHPDQWRDRVRKARLMGLNTIETYIAWNAYEPVRGRWDQTGALDVGGFLDIVADEGMHAIVRPGPYICAEWHNGGLPVWLTRMRDVRPRSSDPRYLEPVVDYLRRVYDIVTPRQIDRDGTVVLVQIENEYGAYGSDEAYLAELVRITREAGITVPLTTVDQPQPHMLRGGSTPGAHLTASFGSRSAERLATLRRHQPTGPLMCSEFWNGWFDWWGGVHHTTATAASAHDLDELLAAGASVNLYMFHGGTNFGATAGANDKGRYKPLVTSYDYDAPLDESGHPTEKYHAFREVISRYAPVPDELPPARPAAPEMTVALAPAGVRMPWIDPVASARSVRPTTFDEIDALTPVVAYETDLPDDAFLDADALPLVFDEVRDLAWVSVDDRPVGRISRTLGERALAIPAGRRLRVVVEDQGRVNYGSRLGEAKGLIGSARLGATELTGWTATAVDVDALASAAASSFLVGAEAGDIAASVSPGEAGAASLAGPIVLVGEFDAVGGVDLFLDTATWGKGFAFVNGFPLGRYWQVGPQRTLYVPGSVVRNGRNVIVVIEWEQVVAAEARFVAEPGLGPLEE